VEADSDAVPLDGKAELTEAERAALRRFLRDQERMRWLGRLARRWWPMLAGIASAAYAIAVGWSHFVAWAAKQAGRGP
jgi:hypothetical protein